MGVGVAREFSEQDGELSATAPDGGGAKIPPELLVRPPRKVRLRPERRVAVILKWILYALIDLPGIAIVAYVAIHPFFIRYTQPRPATIVYLRANHYRRGGTHYHVGYSYALNGLQRTADENVNDALYHSLRVGQTVEVCAARLGPFHYAQIKNGDPVSDPFALVTLGLLWNAIFFLYVWAVVLVPRHLVRMGNPTVGRITNKYGGNSYCLKYTFRTAKGSEKERPDYVPRRVYERVSVGDEVVVVYQVDGAGESDIYDFSDYEAGW